MSFELTILGSSSALPTSKRFSTAHLLQIDERFFLIDCGEGTQIQLRKYKLSPVRINHIFISHLHGDHLFGLFGLLSSMGIMGKRVPVNLYGPIKLRQLMKHHLSFFGPLPFELNIHSPEESQKGFLFEDEKLTVQSIQLQHRTETFGFLFREKKRLLNIRKELIRKYGLGIADIAKIKSGKDYISSKGETIPNNRLTLPPFHQRSYAYISDTIFDTGIVGQIKGVDILFHESTFAGRDQKLARDTFHSTATQAATIAKEAGVGKLLIGHYSSRYKDPAMLVEEARSVFPGTEGVNDGDIYSVPIERVSTK